jgi:hypothetical protein
MLTFLFWIFELMLTIFFLTTTILLYYNSYYYSVCFLTPRVTTQSETIQITNCKMKCGKCANHHVSALPITKLYGVKKKNSSTASPARPPGLHRLPSNSTPPPLFFPKRCPLLLLAPLLLARRPHRSSFPRHRQLPLHWAAFPEQPHQWRCGGDRRVEQRRWGRCQRYPWYVPT